MQARAVIYFSESEGWIHVLVFNTVDENGDIDIASCRSELIPYSKEQIQYYKARANADVNISILEAERVI